MFQQVSIVFQQGDVEGLCHEDEVEAELSRRDSEVEAALSQRDHLISQLTKSLQCIAEADRSNVSNKEAHPHLTQLQTLGEHVAILQGQLSQVSLVNIKKTAERICPMTHKHIFVW